MLVMIQANAQTKEEIRKIQAASNMEELRSLSLKYKQMEDLKKERVSLLARQNNWPVFKFKPDGSFDQLMDVTEDGKPIYYTLSNVDAAKSTRTDYLNTGGSLGLNLNGQNMTAYVWDGGAVRTSHQEFGSRVAISDGAIVLNGNSYHATHVTGTIAAAGIDAAAKGMAPQATVKTLDWNNDLSEMTTAAANGMLLSNHSYGYSANGLPVWWLGAYIERSRDLDNLLFNVPYYLMVQAAMNDGFLGNPGPSYDSLYNENPVILQGNIPQGNLVVNKLSAFATAKNNLVVANAEDATIAANGSLINANIHYSSSQGPTLDLRIKPDITGNGTLVYSTSDGNDDTYGILTGTSMATPNVTGTLLLLQQHYNSLNGNFMRAATLKGLALHTADNAGTPGPDAIFGWGLLNAKKAAETISQNGNHTIIQELTLTNKQTQSFSVNADGINTLMASISWTDPAGIAGTTLAPVLVNDLDIRVTKNGTSSFPYKLTSDSTNTIGDNLVDPYERVDLPGASGSYIITVTHKGVLANGNQNYSLIITGINVPPCLADVSITGNYSAPLTQSQTWIKSTGQTTISNTANVRLDASPTSGYILLQPAVAADFFLAAPTASGSFTAQAIDGCGIAVPSFVGTQTTPAEMLAANTTVNDEKEDFKTPESAFTVYPNPGSGIFTISTPNIENGMIEVYNLAGKRIYHTKLKPGISDHTLDISTSPRGMYLVRISSDGKEIATQKLIIE